jgi:Fur family iron response transcriptional regulator
MSPSPKTDFDAQIVRLLKDRGINPTQQRILITRTLFARGIHLAAEDVFRIVSKDNPISKATVYNTLGLLASRGVIREVIADPSRIFYDPNTSAHHHFFDEVSGELTDIDAAQVNVTGLPPLPDDAELRAVDVVVRIRRNVKK